jgi:hypothetical protein
MTDTKPGKRSFEIHKHEATFYIDADYLKANGLTQSYDFCLEDGTLVASTPVSGTLSILDKAQETPR